MFGPIEAQLQKENHCYRGTDLIRECEVVRKQLNSESRITDLVEEPKRLDR
jgi:hypothetical protein